MIQNRIREVRQSRGLSQAELALKAGVTPGAMSGADNPETSPRLPTLLRIAKALAVPIEQLIVDAPAAAPQSFEEKVFAELQSARRRKQ